MKKSPSPEHIKKSIFVALLILFSSVFLVCAVFLTDYFIQSVKQQARYEELSKLVQQHRPRPQLPNSSSGDATEPNNTGSTDSTDSAEGSDDSQNSGNTSPTLPAPQKYVTVIDPVTSKEIQVLTEYAPIYKLNPHLVGWIQIEGTKVNYPVLQTPDWANYYLTRDFNGNESRYGAIYVNETADVKAPSDNVTIYGHKMRDGTMFASLHEYKKKSFFEAHPYVIFDTIYEHHDYQILSVFMTSTGSASDFAYHTFVDGDKEAFEEFVAKCKELSLYDTGVSASYGDKLITLSTCEHSITDGRFVVVAKRIS